MTTQRRAFIVCGPESSGNRLLASILIRAGCGGSSSTDQLKFDEIDGNSIVIIKHHLIYHEFCALSYAGFDVVCLLLVRDQIATANSQIAHGFETNFDTACQRIITTILQNLTDIRLSRIPARIVTFESLASPHFVGHLLGSLGLRNDNLHEPLSLEGQELVSTQPDPFSVNRKYY